MEIKAKGSKFLRIYKDNEDYYLKNKHGNILEVTKVILMETFGYIFLRVKDSMTEDNVGMWRKKLPAEEGAEWVTKKEWQELENERLKITPTPVEKPKEKIKMGPDEGKIISAEEEAEAKAKAETEAAAAEEEAAKIAEDEAKAQAEADAAGNEGEN